MQSCAKLCKVVQSCPKLMAKAVEIYVVKTENFLLINRFETLDVDKLQRDLADDKVKLVMVVMELDEKETSRWKSTV